MAAKALPNPSHDGEMTQEHYRVQKKFVAEYVLTMNKVKAARAVGVMRNGAGTRADEIMAWPNTMRLIATELEGYALECKVTKRWMLAQLFEAYEIALSQEVMRAQDVLKILQAISEHTGLNQKDIDNELRIVIKRFAAKEGSTTYQVPSGNGVTGESKDKLQEPSDQGCETLDVA